MFYYLYARKSSESEERQVQSIDDQVNRLKLLAQNLGINIKKVFSEAKSAKEPGNRPIFEDMMKKIEAGEAQGILCWQINRLSRNPVDSAKVQWLLQQGIIKSIQTIDKEYKPEDNVLLFNVESGMANQFILDLKKNVRRGLDSKLEKGWFPARAPEGYLNDKEDNTIIKDPDRFDLVRQIWDMALKGTYTVPKMLDIISKEWGYMTKKRRKTGGGSISQNGLYKLLSNIFYAGYFNWAEKTYKGSHEAMITIEEFDRVQQLLGKKGKPRPKSHVFPFTGMIRCAECNCLVTAENKRKYIKGADETRVYTYYHCTNRKDKTNCKKQAFVKGEDIEKQIENKLSEITILPEFLEWALEVLNSKNDQAIEDRNKIYETQLSTLANLQNQIDNLTKLRYRDLITDDEFVKERKDLTEKRNHLKDKIGNTEREGENWLELTEKTFHFATYARYHFLNGNAQTKKEIFAALGQNFYLKDGKLLIEANEWLTPIQKEYPKLEQQYLSIEPRKRATASAKQQILTRWQGQGESNPC